METKECSKCKVTFSLEKFSKDKNTKSGFMYYCKNCVKNYRSDNKENTAITDRKYREENKVKIAEYSKKYREDNKVKIAKSNKKYYEENIDYFKKRREENIDYRKKYYEENKEKYTESGKKWRIHNVHLRRAIESKRRSKKLNATPTWISQLETQQIKSLYKQATDLELTTGIPHHVDHFIPLIHPLVCGFHCFSNLRVITAKENLQKGNKFTPFIESDSGYSE